jgi:hypothetical protein
MTTLGDRGVLLIGDAVGICLAVGAGTGTGVDCGRGFGGRGPNGEGGRGRRLLSTIEGGARLGVRSGVGDREGGAREGRTCPRGRRVSISSRLWAL